jgi:predicted nucleic acid-binding protein
MDCCLDTSLLVALLIREPATRQVQTCLSAVRDQAWLISPSTITEFSSALALKERVGDALHLALCKRSQGTLATMDAALAAAGQETAVAVELIRA